MKRKTPFSIVLLLAIFVVQAILQKAYSQACTFVSPLVQVVTSENVIINGSPYCKNIINLSVDIDVNNGNKYTYIHLWTTTGYRNGNTTFTYGKPPTNADILSNTLVNLALDYSNLNKGVPPALSNTYGPDGTVNVQDAAEGVTITQSPSTTVPGATHFVFSNVEILVPGVCNASTTFKGDSWSSQSDKGTTVQCTLQGFTFALSDPTVTGQISCGTPNILTFTVNSNGSGNIIKFKFDVYANTNSGTPETNGFDASDQIIYTGGTEYTINETGTPDPRSRTFTSGTAAAGQISIPAIYPTPYSTTLPQSYMDVFIVIKDITITNGATTTTITNDLVNPVINYCKSLPVTFGTINAINKGGKLAINWQSLKEENVKEYVVEASKDSKNWKEIGRLNSQTTNGNSNQALFYELTAGLPVGFAAVSFVLMLLLPVFRSRTARVLTVIAAIVIFAACAKNSGKELDTNKKENVFIRIAQHDIDGKVNYSNVIKVINE